MLQVQYPTLFPPRNTATHNFFFFINFKPLKKRSTDNYTPFALDRKMGSLTVIMRPS